MFESRVRSSLTAQIHEFIKLATTVVENVRAPVSIQGPVGRPFLCH